MNNSKTVLITGASSGIGRELSKFFAKDNYNLILTARNEQKLNDIAEKLTESYNSQITIIKKDLSKADSAEELYKEIKSRNLEIDILINNAGFGKSGPFCSGDTETYSEMIRLNILSLTILTKLFLKDMIKKGSGKILNVASTGAYVPGPYTAVYYATKAYVLSFTEAISNETKNTGINISVLCPGPTLSGFAERAGRENSKIAMSSESVARIAYKGLIKNKKLIIPGFTNKMAVFFSKLLPGKSTAGFISKMQKSKIK